MKLTPQQKNRLRIVKKAIDRAFAKLVARGRKTCLHNAHAFSVLNKPLSDVIDTLFTSISNRKRAPLGLESLGEAHAGVLKECLLHLYTSTYHRKEVERELLADLYRNSSKYELLAQMPLPRRERKKAEPLTPAGEAAAKIEAWERKARLAKTKIAKYTRRYKRLLKKEGSAT